MQKYFLIVVSLLLVYPLIAAPSVEVGVLYNISSNTDSDSWQYKCTLGNENSKVISVKINRSTLLMEVEKDGDYLVHGYATKTFVPSTKSTSFYLETGWVPYKYQFLLETKEDGNNAVFTQTYGAYQFKCKP